MKNIRNVSFLLTTAFLVDVLNVKINKLSKVFQENEHGIEQMNQMLTATIDSLSSFKIVSECTFEKTMENN